MPAFRVRRLALLAVLILGLHGYAAPHAATSPATSSASTKASTKAGQSESRLLDSLLEERRYPELEQKLASATLLPPERNYFEGILANRQNRLPEAIRLLNSAMPELKSHAPQRAARALHTLADSYVKTFRYADAIDTYTELMANFSRYLGKTERKSTDDDYKAISLLRDAKPQTVEIKQAFTLPTHLSKIGTIDTDLELNGVTNSWIIDTGANFSAVSESFARKLGLTLSKNAATTQGITGAENVLHMAVIPEMHIGDALVRKIVVLVMEDRSLNLVTAAGKYQIDAILGYPVLSALGAMRFEKNAIRFGPTSGDANAGAALYMEFLTPLLQCRVGGRELLFSFDTGASGSVFTFTYYKQFRDSALRNAPKKPYGMGGAGGIRRFQAFYQSIVNIGVGERTAKLRDVPVIPQPMDTDLDKLNGNLGRDLVEGFRDFTMDFTHMRFTLGEPLPATAKASN